MNSKLSGAQLHRIGAAQYRDLPASGLVLVLDNIRSAHNVGSIFRTADAFKVDRISLCGICACPPSAEIHKAALGAEDAVPWEYAADTLAAVTALRSQGYRILSVEQTEQSCLLHHFRREPGVLYALVFGNEVDGVRQDVVDSSDQALEIPQYGTKHSLNVSVYAGIVLWQFHAG